MFDFFVCLNREVDRNLDELTGLKHEKWEIEKRLRRLKFDKYNNSNSNPNVKKMANLIREKDLNSSDNESPDETDDETSTTVNDPAAATADDQDIETLDETKIDDLDKRYTLVARKYLLIKRRVIHKQCRIRTLHLGQDRYRRRYWYFSHLSGIYVEGLASGDISADDIQTTVENVTKHKLDNGNEPSNHTTSSRSTQRRTKQPQPQARPSISVAPVEPIESTKTNENDDDKQTTNAPEDLATMDLSAFCMAVNRDNNDVPPVEEEQPQPQPITNGVKTEPSEEVHETKTEEVADDNLPLDLSCSKAKRSCQEDYWTAASQHPQTIYPLTKTLDQFQELNDLATAAMLLNNIKQEQTNINIQNLITTPFKQEMPSVNFKEIEQSIREKYQYAQPLPIPDDVQSGWWIIQTPDELRLLIKSLAKRGQRERYLCRMLQRYFDVLTQSMFNHSTNDCDSTTAMSTNAVNDDENENDHDEQENSNDSNDNEHQQQQQQNFDDTHEMDVLNEIYNLSDRIIASSLQSRSYDIDSIRKRLTYSDIQAKGSEILDEAKHLLTDLERNIERRYLKHPFVRRYELNLSSLNRINQNSTYHHTLENSTNEIVSSSKYDEVPQQLERWRRTVNESRTPAQLALCLTQLERCIAWEKSIMRVFCQICNSDVDEEKLLLCDGCDHGTHTYCFNPPMSFIPPNDWYCYVCIGKAKGENLCFVCGNKGEQVLNRCDTCSKLFHEDCLKNARQQRGKWLCVQCLANDSSALIASLTAGNNTNTKWSAGRQTSRSSKTRQPSITSNGANRSSANNNRKSSKSRPSESSILQESHSNSSHADVLNESSSVQSADEIDESIPSPTMGGGTNSNSKKKPAKKSKTVNNDVKSCRIILNELLKSDASWPFQTPVDAKQHPEYYECVKTPMDFSTMKKKMRNNQYTKRDDFLNDVQLILNNCEYYNEDDSPVGEAGHVLRTFFEAQWAKQFG